MDDLERDKPGWTFQKEISVGNVITILCVVVAGLSAWSTLDKRVALTEERAIAQRQVDERQDAEAARRDVQTQAALERINAKLDRIMERR
jgi:hypothetical protein